MWFKYGLKAQKLLAQGGRVEQNLRNLKKILEDKRKYLR